MEKTIIRLAVRQSYQNLSYLRVKRALSICLNNQDEDFVGIIDAYFVV